MIWQEFEQRLKCYQPKASQFPQSLQEAAVLVPILKKEEPEIILTLRADNLSTHSGEVAFPGGKRDAADSSLLETALRESYEEIALSHQDVEVVGTLQTLISKHHLAVKPYVGFVNETFVCDANVSEIARVFTAPIAFFAQPPQFVTHRVDGFGVEWFVPCYHYKQFKIWGLTAIMIVELVNVLFESDISLHKQPNSAELIK